MATPISLRFSIPDATKLETSTEGKEYPLGSEISVVDETSNEEVRYIYLQANGAIAANSINYQDVNCTAIQLPAAGLEKLVMPVGSNSAVTASYYGWFVVKGRFTGTDSGAGIAAGTSVDWAKNTTTLTANVGLKSAYTVGYAPALIGVGQTGDIYLYGNTGVDIA
jgi:hypothetical protein